MKTIVLIVALASQSAYAESRLQPSQISTSDCVAVRITNAERQFVFFTDRCSAADYFIGLDGNEYTLHRVGKKPKNQIYYAGRFAGDGLFVEISAVGKKLEECEEIVESEKSLFHGVHRVIVTVHRDKQSVKIPGVYDDCP